MGDLVDLLAPGYKINSTISLEENINPSISGPYARLSGTSMAAPFVAGAAAMLWYLFPDLSGPEIKKILIDSARDLYNSDDGKYYKLLNLYKALLCANNFGKKACL